jgi:hypothetical protein
MTVTVKKTRGNNKKNIEKLIVFLKKEGENNGNKK